MKKMLLLLSSLFLLSCDKMSHDNYSQLQLMSSCTYPEDYGAIVDDGLDDRLAIQSAINAAQLSTGCVEFGYGTYHVSRKQEAGIANIASIKIVNSVKLKGTGPSTVISMLGSGIRQGMKSASDWWLVGIYGSNVSISDMTLDGSERINTAEQTHLIQINNPSENIKLERLELNLPTIGASSGGDCIRLLGTHLSWVKNVLIKDVVGLSCDRSFVGIQRGVDGLNIFNSESIIVGDQAVDFEPTGGINFVGPCVKNVFMTFSKFRRGPGAQGQYSISIGGDGEATANNIVLSDSIVEDGGVHLIDVSNVTLERLSLKNKPDKSANVIQARKRIENLKIIDCVIENLQGLVGPAISIHHQSGVSPTDVLILGTTIIQTVDSVAVNCESLKYLSIAKSKIIYKGQPTTNVAVKVRGISQVVTAPILFDVIIEGPFGGIASVAGLNDGSIPVLIRTTKI